VRLSRRRKAALSKLLFEAASGDMTADDVSHSCLAELSDEAFQPDFKAGLRMREQLRYRGDIPLFAQGKMAVPFDFRYFELRE
jgi:hypothetical protein